MSSVSQVEKDGDNIPLFIRNLSVKIPDRPTGEVGDHLAPPGLSQSMIDKIASESKSNGDKLFREKKYQEAHNAYRTGYAMPTSDPDVRKSIVLNMAATNLHLKDWFAVLRDTSYVLKIDPHSVKGLYRAARALIELEHFEEALDCCERALKLEPHNKPLEEERLRALGGAVQLYQQALSTAYRRHRLLMIPSAEDILGTGPATNPSWFPYLDPPLPSDPAQATLFGQFNITYPERSSYDLLADFPFDQPILPLFDVLLPGPTPSYPLSALQEKLILMPDGSTEPSASGGFLHPTKWDPKYEFLPPKLAVYALTRSGAIIPVVGQMTLVDVCAATKGSSKSSYEDPNEFYKQGEDYIELAQGLILLQAFRKGSEAEARFKYADYDSLSDLVESGYEVPREIGMRTNGRTFNYGPPNRAINHRESLSFIARRGMIRLLCGN